MRSIINIPGWFDLISEELCAMVTSHLEPALALPRSDPDNLWLELSMDGATMGHLET
jgi:hypothetical protein